MVQAAQGNLVKVILETCFLSDEEIKKACLAAQKAKANFVKTSTGFGTGGAKVEHINIMKTTVGDSMGIKASGGIRTYCKRIDRCGGHTDRSKLRNHHIERKPRVKGSFFIGLN